MRKLTGIIFFILLSIQASAQSKAYVYGTVKDSLGAEIADVSVIIAEENNTVLTKENGKYTIEVPANKTFVIAFSYAGHSPFHTTLGPFAEGEKHQFNVTLNFTVNLSVFNFVEQNRGNAGTININIKEIKQLPNVSGSFEQVLKTLPGVTSNNELSSQYNVRGGNYDENLVYVNDIEIYRPFLPRSGQQEGLSFIHTELVQNIKFSAGGFEAKYGDKLSSVLDIKYKEPKKFGASANLSLLGAQSHIEGATKNLRFTYLLSARYWTNQLLVGGLDEKGDYQPSFTDVQSLLTWHLNSSISISALGSFAKNKYLVIPQTRETTFGTVKQAMSLKMFFDGQDLMEYQTLTGAVSIVANPNRYTNLKLISSIFNSNENELYTVEGAYRLEEVETNFGNDNFGKAKATKGIGYFLNNARNHINATVYNVGHKGYYSKAKHNIQWGAQFQGEHILDKINEWDFKDSLGFAQPSQVNGMPVVLNYINNQINLQTHRISGYIQNTQKLNSDYNLQITYGIRSNWWSYNNENVISPRVQLSFEPNRKYNRALYANGSKQKPRKDISIKAAWGYYYQPPFYREFRNFSGNLNPNIKAQKAIHYVLGGDVIFKMWNRDFKFFSEAYYKQLENLIPYEIDNVRLRYYADNIAQGYATGIDFRLNGEIVKGAESWVSISIMQTQEKIPSAIVTDAAGNRITPGYIPRQTDQRATFSMFFQDYFRKSDRFKVNLTLVFGTGLPYGPPDRNRYGDTSRLPAYKRVDIGFLYLLVDEKQLQKKGWQRWLKSAWIGMDAFNLLDINNTISHIWIEDIEGRTWAVPNYLTSRRINLRLQANF
ncbi:MAG: TonB-dependent receptor [Bacteroidia bacterium]|nr:TonB-dependent receptor [Bacteroidia bacterium]